MTSRPIPLLLVALLLLSSLAPLASAGEAWTKETGSAITAVATDERGDRIFVGTEGGGLYCYDAGGNVVWQKTLSRVPTALHADGTGDYLLVGFAGDQNFDLYDATTGNSLFSRGWGPSYRAGDISRSGDAYAYIFSNQPYFGIAGNTRNTGKIWYEEVLSGATAPAIAGDASWAVVGTGSDIKKYALNIPDKDKEGWIAAEGRGEFRNRVAHTIGGSASTLTNLSVEINVTRTAGTNTGNTLYAPDCQANFNDIRFATADGAELRFIKKSVQGSTATFLVEIPELPPAGTTIYIYWGYMPFYGGASDKSDTPLLSDDFEDGVIADVWQISGSVTETGGYLDLYDDRSAEGHGPATATAPALANIPCHIVANVSIPSIDLYSGQGFSVRFPIGLTDTYIRQLSGGPATITWAGASQPDVTVPRDTTHTMEIWWAPGGTCRWKYGTAWDFSTSSAGTSNPFEFSAGTSAQGWMGAIRIHDITVYPYTYPAAIPRTWGTVERAVYSQATKTLDGTITNIDAPETGDWVAVSTTTRSYIIEVTPTGFGTTVDLGARTGTPYDLAVANNAAALIEGRGILADIFRFDGVQTGTYTAGGPVQHVAIAQKNGLYAAAGSDDGKYYIFSKDESSSWYLLHASDSEDPVTAIAMSWRGEIAVIGRADGSVTLYTTTDAPPPDSQMTIYAIKDGQPYIGKPVSVSTADISDPDKWTPLYSSLRTDSEGKIVISTHTGHYYQININNGEKIVVIQASSATPIHSVVFRSPLIYEKYSYDVRYNASSQAIEMTYTDNEGPATVSWSIVRTDTYSEVFSHTTSGVTTATATYPISEPDISYKVNVKVQRSSGGSIQNMWFITPQNASPIALPFWDENIQNAVFIIFLMILGGIFYYSTGAKGALIVALVAALFRYFSWITVPWFWIIAAVVFAFLANIAEGA